jgi:hypothetical protein
MPKIKEVSDSIAVVLNGDVVKAALQARKTIAEQIGFEPSWRQTIALLLNQFNKTTE